MRIPKDWTRATDSLCRKLTKDGCYAPRTIRFYREHCILVGKRLEGMYGHIMPHEVRKEHIVSLLERMRSDKLAIATQRNFIVSLKKICEHYNNHAFKEVRILWPEDTRPNVNWLTPDQARTILESDLTPIQDAIVSLELCAGLRRIELLRLTVADIHPDYIEVHGKGHVGGKLRSVPIQQRVRLALDRWLAYRSDIVQSCQDAMYVSDALFVYRHGRYIYPYSDVKCTGIDRHLKLVCTSTGIEFAHHTLRRTFARQLWLSGAQLVTIAKILGHKSTEQTLEYIGANHDDMASAMMLLKF